MRAPPRVDLQDPKICLQRRENWLAHQIFGSSSASAKTGEDVSSRRQLSALGLTETRSDGGVECLALVVAQIITFVVDHEIEHGSLRELRLLVDDEATVAHGCSDGHVAILAPFSVKLQLTVRPRLRRLHLDRTTSMTHLRVALPCRVAVSRALLCRLFVASCVVTIPTPAIAADPPPVWTVDPPPPSKVRVQRFRGEGLFGIGIAGMASGFGLFFASAAVGYAGNVAHARADVTRWQLERIEQYGPPDAYLPTLRQLGEQERRADRLDRAALICLGLAPVVIAVGSGLVAWGLVRADKPRKITFGVEGLVLRF